MQSHVELWRSGAKGFWGCLVMSLCLDAHDLVFVIMNYEHQLTMLSSIIQNMHVDVKWVAKENLQLSKMNKWKCAHDDDALKCFNYERILEAEQLRLPEPFVVF